MPQGGAATMQRIHHVTVECVMTFAVFVTWEAIQVEHYANPGPGPGFFSF